jgi:hypothetical protein
VTDSGSPAEPVASPLWAAPGAPGADSPRGTVFGSAGAPLAPPTGPTRVGSAPVEALVRPRTVWTPPPKRGLLPLRPIAFGAILGAPFRLQRRAPRTTLGPALVVSLATTALAALLQWLLVIGPQAALDASYYQDYAIASNVLGVAGAIAWWIPLGLAFAATALLAGPVAISAARSLLAERVSFRGVRWRLTGRLGHLVGWASLVLLLAAVVLVLASALPLLVATTSMTGGFFAFLVGFGEVILIVLLGGYLAARLGFTAHVIAIEGLGIGGALRRSWRLTRRSGFRLLGATLLIWIIVGLGTWVFTLPVGWALDLGVNLIFPNGADSAQAELYGAVRTIIVTAVAAIAGAFGLVVQTVTAALLYLDQRMRVEGLDLALARYVDDRQRGATVADPFPGGGAR